MIEKILQYTNLIQLFVVITFVTVLFRHDRTNPLDRILILILSVSLLNELITCLLMIFDRMTSIVYTVNVAIHHGLWIFLLSRLAKFRQPILYAMSGYLGFALFNILLLEGTKTFNYNTFIVGAILYLILFLIESFRQLRLENLSYFTHRNYLLLCAPILLFVCLSFIFGFKSRTLATSIIFGNIPLYTAIGFFANLVYYSLINIYIFRPKNSLDGI